LLRNWSHTWQKKATKKNQNSDTLNPQPVQSFSTPHYAEKTGGLLCCQRLAPNLLGRCRTTGEQISSMRYSHNHPWDKPAEPPGQTDPCPAKKTQELNKKQELKRNMQQRGWGALSTLEKQGRART
jgi:hypothetical protein